MAPPNMVGSWDFDLKALGKRTFTQHAHIVDGKLEDCDLRALDSLVMVPLSVCEI